MLVLRKYRLILPRKALETIYISMIRPILEYGNVLYDNCTLSNKWAIENIQRQAALLCTGGYRHTDYKNLLIELNWESLSDRRKQHKLVILYKIINKIYPDYLYRSLNINTNTHYNLRQPLHIRPRKTRLNNSHNSFFPSTIRQWNLLPQNIKDSHSVNTFKALVRGTNNFNPYHRLSSGKSGIWLTRLRLGLSALNSHRFKYNFIDSPLCPNCLNGNETLTHYFFDCPTHRIARTKLFQRLSGELGINVQDRASLLNILLEGETIMKQNLKVLLSITLEYLTNSNRFK